MKKFASFLLLMSVCMFTFSGCGGAATEDTKPATDTTEVDQEDGSATVADDAADTNEEKTEEPAAEEKTE